MLSSSSGKLNWYGHFCVSDNTIFDNKAFYVLNKHTHSNAVSGAIISSVKQRHKEDASCEETQDGVTSTVPSSPYLCSVHHYMPNKLYCNTLTQKEAKSD